MESIKNIFSFELLFQQADIQKQNTISCIFRKELNLIFQWQIFYFSFFKKQTLYICLKLLTKNIGHKDGSSLFMWPLSMLSVSDEVIWIHIT